MRNHRIGLAKTTKAAGEKKKAGEEKGETDKKRNMRSLKQTMDEARDKERMAAAEKLKKRKDEGTAAKAEQQEEGAEDEARKRRKVPAQPSAEDMARVRHVGRAAAANHYWRTEAVVGEACRSVSAPGDRATKGSSAQDTDKGEKTQATEQKQTKAGEKPAKTKEEKPDEKQEDLVPQIKAEEKLLKTPPKDLFGKYWTTVIYCG